MAERDWVRPEFASEFAAAPGPGRPGTGFELRPLSLGELLDRTFSLYRSRFLLFAAIAMVAAAVQVAAQAVSVASAQAMIRQGATHPAPGLAGAMANLRMVGTMSLRTYSVLLLFFLVSAVTHAATTLAVTEVYLGQPATAKEALLRVAPRWYRWIGIALWQLGSFVWLPLAAALPMVILAAVLARNGAGSAGGFVVVGLLTLLVLATFPVGFILYLRNALAIPAAVMEGLSVRPAMRRSKVLAAGAKGRLFVVLLIAFILLEIVGVLQVPLSLTMYVAPGQQHYLARGLSLLITFVGHTVVAPVSAIGLTLVYFDQRVRKEALDLELLLQGTSGGSPVLPLHGQAIDGQSLNGQSLNGQSIDGQPERYAPER